MINEFIKIVHNEEPEKIEPMKKNAVECLDKGKLLAPIYLKLDSLLTQFRFSQRYVGRLQNGLRFHSMLCGQVLKGSLKRELQ